MIYSHIVLIIAANLVWQTTLITGAVFLTLYALPRTQAKTRYRIALTGLFGTLILFAAPFLPKLSQAPSIGIAPPPISIEAVGAFPSFEASTFIEAAQNTAATNQVMPNPSTLLLSIWLFGSLIMLARLFTAWRQAVIWRRRALPNAQARSEFLSSPATILRSEHVNGPLVLGLMRPAILVPLGFSLDLESPKTRAVLEHEIAHIIRHDLWVNLAQRLVLCLLWWCAPLYWVNAQIGIEREKICDDIAAQKTGKGKELARALIDLAETNNTRNQEPLLAIGIHPRASLLAERVQRLYTGNTMHKISMKLMLTSSLAVPLALLSLAALTPRALAHNPYSSQALNPSKPISTLQHALYASVESGDVLAVKKLLSMDVNPNFVLHGDGTPLFTAVRRNDMQIINMLIDAGADVNLAAPGDGNPLIQAAMRGHIEIAKLLLEKGADINAIVPGDETPLINAAQQGRLNMVKLLLANGADISLGAWAQTHDSTIREWRTPLGEAKKRGNKAVAKHLELNGARLETRTYEPTTNSVHSEITTFGKHSAADTLIVQGRVTSKYGLMRRGKKHRGIDITNKVGTPIYAPADGGVQAFNEFSFSENYGKKENYGKTIELETAGGVKTLFAHLHSFAAAQGEQVKAGDVIAYMGNSGVTTGPHVHIETHVNGKRVNPRKVWPSLPH